MIICILYIAYNRNKNKNNAYLNGNIYKIKINFLYNIVLI